MLALVCRLYTNQLGIVYVLIDKSGKTHLVTSEEYLFKIRDKIVNYKIEKRKVNGKLNTAIYNPPDAVLKFSKLSFKTTDYFDIRDITFEAYFARVATLFAQGYPRKAVAEYEYRKWCKGDNNRYAESVFLTNEAKQYLASNRSC